ncbi:hypothetical protein [Streptomyces hoynatensis]|nr:hypothetical protein [Streptomyces hoynatensis]
MSDLAFDAASVCSGSITGPASRDLEAMAGVDRFGEGGDSAVDLAEYVERLRESDSPEERFCEITTGAYEEFARIVFGWVADDAHIIDDSPGVLTYSAGEYAYALTSGAFVYFPCEVAGAEQGRLVRAGLIAPAELDPDKAMSVLNSASRAIADGLGCLEGAGLPEGRPGRAAE